MKKLFASFLAMVAKPDEPEARKRNSIKTLKKQGVPYIDHLPPIEQSHETTLRSEEEIVQRIIALAIVGVKGETGDHEFTQEVIDQFDARGFFTPKEQIFLDDLNPSETERIQFTWRYEGVHLLFWAIQIFDALDWPSQITDVPKIAETLRDMGTDGLRELAKLRDQKAILDQADLIYRIHWAVVDARLNGQSTPGDLDGGVVLERHYALNWLIGYADQAWDDVSTDT